MEYRTLSARTTPGFLPAWESFVQTHPETSTGHLAANFEMAAAAGAGNHSFLLVDERDRPLAALPLFEVEERDLRFFRRRILTSSIEFPAHPLLAPGLTAHQEKDALDRVFQEVEAIGAACNADDISVTYPALIQSVPAIEKHHYCPLQHFGFLDDNLLGMLLDLRRDLEQIEGGLNKSCRNVIRRAQKEGCVLRPVRDREEWMACYDLAKATLGRLVHSEPSHAACWDSFVVPGYARTFAVTPPGSDAPSNVIISVKSNVSWYYWKSFNSRQIRIPGANNLALWGAITSARELGAAFFELGSLDFGNPKSEAISSFKRSFGGVPTYMFRGVRHRRPIRRAALGLLSALYHYGLRARRSSE